MHDAQRHPVRLVGVGPLVLLLILVAVGCYVLVTDRGWFGAGGCAALTVLGLGWTAYGFWRSREDFDARRAPAYCAAVGYAILLTLLMVALLAD